jgi:hypothetical protein
MAGKVGDQSHRPDKPEQGPLPDLFLPDDIHDQSFADSPVSQAQKDTRNRGDNLDSASPDE